MSHSYPAPGAHPAYPAYPAEPVVPPSAAPGQDGPPAARSSGAAPGIVITHPWDFVRSIAAGLFLIMSLRLPWSPADDADEVVHVLATTLIALFSLGVLPLSRVLRAADGSPVAWPTFPIRAAMCVPYAVVVVVSVFRDLVDAGPPLGAAVHVGIFGVVLAALPRDTEIAAIRNVGVIVNRVRQACGAAGVLAAAALLITILVSLPPNRWFGTGGIFLEAVLPVLALLGLVFYLFVATAVFIGLGHVSWQPTLLWLGAPLVLVLGESGLEESIRGGFYGIWLLVLSVALASVPLVGGKDGAKNEARFWVSVVMNAFRLLLTGNAVVLLLILVLFVQAAQRPGGVPGELIWLLMSAAATVAALWFASTRFRADPRHGRNVALVAVIALSGLRVIDIAVAPVNANATSGLAASFSLTVVVYWVILYALTVPRVVRVTYRSGWVGQNTSAPAVPPPAGYPGSGGADVSGGPALNHQGIEAKPADPDATAVMSTAAAAASEPGPSGPSGEPSASEPADGSATRWPGARPVDARPATVPPRPAPPVPAYQPPDPAALAAADPATSGEQLRSIAAARPDLCPVIAANPSTYPDLLAWLGNLGDPAVDAALAGRPRRSGRRRR